jgi:hypothetical protein
VTSSGFESCLHAMAGLERFGHEYAGLLAGYRVDQRARCTKCDLVVAPEDLFHTVEGDALCTQCKVPWADEQARAVWEGGEAKLRPGFRLVCPQCELASMAVRESDLARVGSCVRCGKKTSQLRGGAFLAASLAMMAAIPLDVALRSRFLVLGTVVLGVIALVVRDQLQRRRHRVATVDEVDHADSVLKGDRQRVAADALRIAEPDPAGATEDQSQAELTAEVESQPKEHAH